MNGGASAVMRAFIRCTLCGLMLTSLAMNRSAPVGAKMLRMKAGAGVFTILDTSGISPRAGAGLAIRDMENGAIVAAGMADNAGRVTVTLVKGRYILSVDSTNLSLIEVSNETEVSEYCIIMPPRGNTREPHLQTGS